MVETQVLPTEQAQTTKPGMSIARSLALCAIFALAVLITSGVLQRLESLDDGSKLLVRQLVAWPIVIWLAFRWSKNLNLKEMFLAGAFSLRHVPALALATFGFMIVFIDLAGWIPMSEELKKSLMESYLNANSAILILTSVFLAPLAEEIFFRGQIFQGYLQRYSLKKSIWVSALLFAVLHLNPWQAVVALPLGLANAWLVVKTGSLLPGMFSHSIANSTGFFLIAPFLQLFGYDPEPYKQADHFPLEVFAVAAIAMAIGSFILWRQLGSTKDLSLHKR